MPGLMVKDRSLVRLGRALVISTEECRARCCASQFWRADPCSPCGIEPDNLPIYVATTIRCEGNPGAIPRVVRIGFRCYTINRNVVYVICPKGKSIPLGVACLPDGAQVVGPGEVECIDDLGCQSPLCGARFWPGDPCPVNYNGPRVFLECVDRCVYAHHDGVCFKFGDLPPLGFLPPDGVLLPPGAIRPNARSCCTCGLGCHPHLLPQDIMHHESCNTGEFIECCGGDTSEACISFSVRFHELSTNPSNPLQYPFTVDTVVQGTQCLVDGFLTPNVIEGTTTYTNPQGTSVFPEPIGLYPTSPPIFSLLSSNYIRGLWPFNTNFLPCPGEFDFTASSFSNCLSAGFAANGRGGPTIEGVTTVWSFSVTGSLSNVRTADCSNHGCSSMGQIEVPIDADGRSRLGRGFVKNKSGLFVPDSQVRRAGGCSGCGGGGGI